MRFTLRKMDFGERKVTPSSLSKDKVKERRLVAAVRTPTALKPAASAASAADDDFVIFSQEDSREFHKPVLYPLFSLMKSTEFEFRRNPKIKEGREAISTLSRRVDGGFRSSQSTRESSEVSKDPSVALNDEKCRQAKAQRLNYTAGASMAEETLSSAMELELLSTEELDMECKRDGVVKTRYLLAERNYRNCTIRRSRKRTVQEMGYTGT